MKRKEFLKSSAAFTCLMCSGAAVALLESCAPKAGPLLTLEKNQKDFSLPETAWDGGNVVMVARKGGPDIFVHKEGNTYTALPLKCSHQGARLKWKENKLICGLHGSVFNADGTVVKGPAKQPIMPYQVQTREGYVFVTIQDKA